MSSLSPTVIELSPETVQECREYNRRVLSKVANMNRWGGADADWHSHQQSKGQTSVKESTRFFEGRLGEVALHQWADDMALHYRDGTNDQGFPDTADLVLFCPDLDHPVTVNIKNSTHPRARYLMQPQAQFDKEKHDFYVGATSKQREDGGVTVTLWGMCPLIEWMRDAELDQVRVPTRKMLLTRLPYPMATLAAMAVPAIDAGS